MFSDAIAPQSQKEVTVSCQYCNSQFKTENPDYVAAPERNNYFKPKKAPLTAEEEQYKKYSNWSGQGGMGSVLFGIGAFIMIRLYAKSGNGEHLLGFLFFFTLTMVLLWSWRKYKKLAKPFKDKLFNEYMEKRDKLST